MLVLVGAVVLVALVVQQAGGSGTSGPSSPSPSSTAAQPAAPATASPQEFCEAFLVFVNAHGNFLAGGGTSGGAPVVAAATALFDLGRPIGLSEGGWASLVELVNGSLASVEGSTLLPVPDAAPPDTKAMDAYLAEACPP
jgi:hypothetical protein